MNVESIAHLIRIREAVTQTVTTTTTYLIDANNLTGLPALDNENAAQHIAD